jgi:hypothetical protein
MRTLITLAAVALLAGCASSGRIDPGYAGYLQAHDRAAERRAGELAAIADATACNGDPTCVTAAKAFAALAVSAGRGGDSSPTQYVRQPSAAERVSVALLGALPGLGQVYATIDAGRNSVRIAEVNAGREVTIVEALGGVTGRVADAFAMLPASTYVGGDLISGTQHIGDTIGRDAIGGNQNIGDTRIGDDVRRDTIGRDRVNTNTDYGSGNRLNSPGPYRDTGNTGDRCTGIGCQTTNPPPPDADPAE